uniref:Uncharacterized protein n=1 Tax=Nicotiana tabacum TaxID=4097 RepID=A0A1S4CHN8_TOBAC|nr:PREDICTED: uncharacterized protein LOC107818937 [Nicotiana tabacum]
MSIPSPNQRISSFRSGYSSVYTYHFTLGFNPPIDPVILDFYRFFTICLAQIGPLVWRTVACLRYLSSKANVNFTFSHLIHLYHPNLIRHGVFTLTARSKKVLVNPEDDKDRGWYIRYVAVRTVDLIGETNIPFPEKWNFEPTMGDVEPIPNFRGWVDSLLKIASREQRTWKSISSLHGWKVKTHGFGIRGMTAEVAMAIRMSANAALDLDKARALLPKRKATKESSEEEEEGTSLITRPRVRRRIIIDDEIENTPARTSTTEPVLIHSDEDAEPRDNNESIQHLFDSGFGSGELGPVFDEAPLSSFVPISSIPLPTVSISLPVLTTSVLLPVSTAPISVPLAVSTAPASAPVLVSTSFPSIPSTAPLPSVHHTETGSSSGSMTMRSVTLEVPANHSLLRKTGRADVWLEPLIGDIEKKKMESHSCLTLMNDVVHSTLKANLIGTELMGRISLLERKARESEKTVHEAEEIARGAQLEATNWKEQFENAQGTIEELQEDKNLLEQQNRGLTSELATVKASSSQLKRDKELLECSLSEQLSRASEEVRELKALLARKEEYAGELVQSLTQAQADLQTSSDEIHALKSSHASLEASLDSHLAEYQILKNDLAMWEKEYGLLEENFNIEVSWAFLKSRRDALTEAAQEGFDLQSELAKVIDTIEKSQQSADTPSPALEVPGTEELLNEEVNTAAIGITIPASAENVAIPASEGETSMTQSVEVEASVTLVSLIDPNISSSAETVPVAASSEVATVPVLELCQVLSPNPSFPVQLKFDLFYLQLFPVIATFLYFRRSYLLQR